jgi:hypothetical protein
MDKGHKIPLLSCDTPLIIPLDDFTEDSEYGAGG